MLLDIYRDNGKENGNYYIRIETVCNIFPYSLPSTCKFRGAWGLGFSIGFGLGVKGCCLQSLNSLTILWIFRENLVFRL